MFQLKDSTYLVYTEIQKLTSQSNGLAERTVKTVKKLISNTDHPLLSLLLSYRATPLPWCGLSPAKLLMGRCIRTGKRSISLLIGLISMISELSEGTPVWISTQGNNSPGTVSQQLESPRSYTVDTPTGQVRRNRRHFRCRSEDTTSEKSETVENQCNRDSTVRRYSSYSDTITNRNSCTPT